MRAPTLIQLAEYITKIQPELDVPAAIGVLALDAAIEDTIRHLYTYEHTVASDLLAMHFAIHEIAA